MFRIVNENTRKPVENPAEKALRESCTVELAEDTLLLARDGTERLIKDSAAPIRDRNGQVLGTVLVFRDISQTRQLVQQLSWQARHDLLTGLANRQQFEHRVRLAIDDAKHENLQHIVCYLDLDQFKVVNDTCAHVAGAELLRQLECDYTYTINLSGASINDDRFLNYVKEQFAHHPIAPPRICFEVTETVAIAVCHNLSDFIQIDKSFTFKIFQSCQAHEYSHEY